MFSYDENSESEEQTDEEYAEDVEYEEEPPELVQGYGDFDRLNISNIFEEYIPQNRLEKILLSERDKFIVKIQGIVKNLDSNDVKLEEFQVKTLVEKTSKLLDIKYKNPYYYILGYLSLDKNQELTKTSFNKVNTRLIPALKKFNDVKIDSENIIRYSTLWKDFLLKD